MCISVTQTKPKEIIKEEVLDKVHPARRPAASNVPKSSTNSSGSNSKPTNGKTDGGGKKKGVPDKADRTQLSMTSFLGRN